MIPLGVLAAAAGRRGGPRLSIAGELMKGPLYIPHRGAALRFPEHTMLAYQSSLALGFPWVEIDVSQLSDGALAAFHDTAVDRVTTSSGAVSALNTAAYEALVIDSNNWHGGGHGDLSPVLVEPVLQTFAGKALFVVDEKSGGGGSIVDELVAAGIPTTQAIVSATNYGDLAAAVSAGYPASIVATPSGASIPADAIANGVEWAAVDYWRGQTFIEAWVLAGINVVVFTVCRQHQRDEMLALGVAGFYSDDPEYLAATAPASSTDNFAAQTWQRGMLAQNYKDSTASTDDGLDAAMRGRFEAPDYWGFLTDSGTNLTRAVLQGWACPINSDPACDDYTIDLKVTFGTVGNGDQSRWAGVFVTPNDKAYASVAGSSGTAAGYLFTFRKNGTLQIYLAHSNQSLDSLLAQDTSGAAIANGAEVRFRVVVTPTQLKIERVDGSGLVVQSVTSGDTTTGRRGGYFHLCHSRMPAKFRDITVLPGGA